MFSTIKWVILKQRELITHFQLHLARKTGLTEKSGCRFGTRNTFSLSNMHGSRARIFQRVSSCIRTWIPRGYRNSRFKFAFNALPDGLRYRLLSLFTDNHELLCIRFYCTRASCCKTRGFLWQFLGGVGWFMYSYA